MAQAIRTATDTSQRVAIVSDGAVIVLGVAEAETLADAIANADQLVGRATQAAGQASLVSQRNAEHEPQGSSTDQKQPSVAGSGERLRNLSEEKIAELSRPKKIFEKNAKDMFADREGHLLDIAKNRALLVNVASDINNFLGIDTYGKAWFAKIMDTGEQVWVEVINGCIRNGGINSEVRIFDEITGLARRLPPC